MTTPPPDAARWLPAAQAGSKEALGQLLDSCRGYLLLIANQELGPDLQAKGGASDLVQETLLDACRDFAHFQGNTEQELFGWLRRSIIKPTSEDECRSGVQSLCTWQPRLERPRLPGFFWITRQTSTPRKMHVVKRH